jgi:hypothetical protein
MNAISFEGFWERLRKLESLPTKEINTKVQRVYLNINHAGQLIRETYDIIEELRMMEQIYAEQ